MAHKSDCEKNFVFECIVKLWNESEVIKSRRIKKRSLIIVLLLDVSDYNTMMLRLAKQDEEEQKKEQASMQRKAKLREDTMYIIFMWNSSNFHFFLRTAMKEREEALIQKKLQEKHSIEQV